ncbi:sentrin-specific protease 7-like protein [Dinothrombium tinctorium]|uniref:Sentrin-specific protease 7-like protein n=1 Tax=Dinothrombium tinctorium TaxID=1965070 RepID=A0A443RGG6_9ACAR|nr:sentrin-specific protease 7-like protein [Dinothrombium tinctorium]
MSKFKFFKTKNERKTTDVYLPMFQENRSPKHNSPQTPKHNSKIHEGSPFTAKKCYICNKESPFELKKCRNCSRNFDSRIDSNLNRTPSITPSSFYGRTPQPRIKKPDCITISDNEELNDKDVSEKINLKEECENSDKRIVVQVDEDDIVRDVKKDDGQIIVEDASPEILPPSLAKDEPIKCVAENTVQYSYQEITEQLKEETSSEPETILNCETKIFKVRQIHFGTYCCFVKGITIGNDGIKFLSVPPLKKETMHDPKFKYHISIPFGEISEALGCFELGKHGNFLFLRTIQSATEKVKKALELINNEESYYTPDKEESNSRYIISQFEPLSDSEVEYIKIKLSEGVKENNLFYKEISAAEALDILKKQIKTIKITPKEQKNDLKQASLDKFVTLEAGTHNRNRILNRLKEFKSNNVIEIDDNQSATSLSSVILIYPPGEKDAIPIYKTDLKCLDDEQYLNDNIMDFYLKYILRDLTHELVASKAYVFSTFFYGKLSKSSKKTDDSSKTTSERYYNRVKNWTKSVDIFDKEFLFIPMNKCQHWFLAIVCYPNLVPEVGREHEINTLRMRPCIVFMDSLGNVKSSRLSDPIRHFLTMEWRMKKGSEKIFNRNLMPDFFPEVPYQNNSSDCGLFVLEYVEQFLKDSDYVMVHIRGGRLNNWFPHSLIENKRSNLKKLILNLSRTQKNGMSEKMEMEIDNEYESSDFSSNKDSPNKKIVSKDSDGLNNCKSIEKKKACTSESLESLDGEENKYVNKKIKRDFNESE